MFDQRSDAPSGLGGHRAWNSRGATVHDISFASSIAGRASAYLVSPLAEGVYVGAILDNAVQDLMRSIREGPG